ncbi:hypothetical protein Taro_032530 [Colocasia esculenta]|uniref:CCHC-type domain-containing protein n=1 Tax=Colocasia esculenta TaxID=4460 RepID=A0A843W6D6_COLES|nr:hypothetical protein [Colocasia esculenta]
MVQAFLGMNFTAGTHGNQRHTTLDNSGIHGDSPMKKAPSKHSSTRRNRMVPKFCPCTTIWLRVVGMVFLLVMVSRGEMSLGVRIRERADVWWSSLLRTRFEDGAVEVGWDEFVSSQRSPSGKKEWPHCGRAHGGTECWLVVGKCLKCGSSDHKIKDCPRLQQGAQRGPAPVAAAAAPATGRPGRPRAPARVFALAREDAEQADHVTEGADVSTSSEEIVRSDSERESPIPLVFGTRPWLQEVGVAEHRPVRTSRDVRRGRSSRPLAPQGLILPSPPPVDYGVFMQGLVQAMQTQAHTQAALLAQLEAQEGEMEQYLEEKKASQKRPAPTFQRQDKKKAVYQTQQ